MNEKEIKERKETKGRRGISLIPSLGIFAFCAIFSVMLLSGAVGENAEKGDLQRAAALKNVEEVSRIKDAAKRLQDQILVELKEDGTIDQIVSMYIPAE